MTLQDVLMRFKSLANPANVAGMERYGIRSAKMLGISLPVLQKLAKELGTDHELAAGLWTSGWMEARILAGMVDDPAKVTERQLEAWAAEFDSWAVVDQVCSCLFDRTTFAWAKAVEWTERPEEFVKRSGFVLMACLAVHDKASPDRAFLKFLPIIEREAKDPRNFVKKAVNWALRQIGKRSLFLNAAAIKRGGRIAKIDDRAARWIASDALRELKSGNVQKRLAKKVSGTFSARPKKGS